jgi:putative DNA primase/helicase
LIVSVACGFASMLLHLADLESGGIHLVGSSSSGKTTALRVAASIFGPPSYVHRWRGTTNGLEAVASLHSDTLLVLDELAQVDPKEAGEIAYMLANGSGKARANKSGAAKTRHSWRLLFLSAGEISLAQHMREVGKKARAGQEVRLIDIPADAGAGFGIFEQLHGKANGADLSQQLLEATAKLYGTAAIAFLEAITDPQNLSSLPTLIKQLCAKFLSENLPVGASGQVHRACMRFAIIAVAGELATRYGITGWQPHEAERAARVCFKAWLEWRGGISDQERITVLSQIRSFLEAHGESRFTEWNLPAAHTINRAGFKKTSSNGTEFYVLPEVFNKELCAGLDHRTATSILAAEDWLLPSENGKPYRREYLPNIGRSRCYVLTSKVWED